MRCLRLARRRSDRTATLSSTVIDTSADAIAHPPTGDRRLPSPSALRETFGPVSRRGAPWKPERRVATRFAKGSGASAGCPWRETAPGAIGRVGTVGRMGAGEVRPVAADDVERLIDLWEVVADE